MPWLVINSRQRELLVSGSQSGHPTFTRDADRALRFAGQDAARKWLSEQVVTGFGELALMRDAAERDTRKGQAGHYRPRAST